MHQKGSIGIVFAILFVIISSLLLGFAVGALTDPNKKSDLRASANERQVKPVIEVNPGCKQTIRWYTIDLFCY